MFMFKGNILGYMKLNLLYPNMLCVVLFSWFKSQHLIFSKLCHLRIQLFRGAVILISILSQSKRLLEIQESNIFECLWVKSLPRQSSRKLYIWLVILNNNLLTKISRLLWEVHVSNFKIKQGTMRHRRRKNGDWSRWRSKRSSPRPSTRQKHASVWKTHWKLTGNWQEGCRTTKLQDNLQALRKEGKKSHVICICAPWAWLGGKGAHSGGRPAERGESLWLGACVLGSAVRKTRWWEDLWGREEGFGRPGRWWQGVRSLVCPQGKSGRAESAALEPPVSCDSLGLWPRPSQENALAILSILASFHVSSGNLRGFPGGAGGKEPACHCRRSERPEFYSWVGRSLGGGHGNSLQYSCLENPMDRGAWWATVIGSQRVRHDWSNVACT